MWVKLRKSDWWFPLVSFAFPTPPTGGKRLLPIALLIVVRDGGTEIWIDIWISGLAMSQTLLSFCASVLGEHIQKAWQNIAVMEWCWSHVQKELSGFLWLQPCKSFWPFVQMTFCLSCGSLCRRIKNKFPVFCTGQSLSKLAVRKGSQPPCRFSKH